SATTSGLLGPAPFARRALVRPRFLRLVGAARDQQGGHAGGQEQQQQQQPQRPSAALLFAGPLLRAGLARRRLQADLGACLCGAAPALCQRHRQGGVPGRGRRRGRREGRRGLAARVGGRRRLLLGALLVLKALVDVLRQLVGVERQPVRQVRRQVGALQEE